VVPFSPSWRPYIKLSEPEAERLILPLTLWNVFLYFFATLGAEINEEGSFSPVLDYFDLNITSTINALHQ